MGSGKDKGLSEMTVKKLQTAGEPKPRLTYIVNTKGRGNSNIRSFTLREYCAENNICYNTVLARIHRAVPENRRGVVYLEENNPVLAKGQYKRGRVPEGEQPPIKGQLIGEKNSLPRKTKLKQKIKLKRHPE